MLFKGHIYQVTSLPQTPQELYTKLRVWLKGSRLTTVPIIQLLSVSPNLCLAFLPSTIISSPSHCLQEVLSCPTTSVFLFTQLCATLLKHFHYKNLSIKITATQQFQWLLKPNLLIIHYVVMMFDFVKNSLGFLISLFT